MARKKKKHIDPNTWLPPEVAEKYEVVNWTGGHQQQFGRFGRINLKKLTLDKATLLIRGEFSKLKERPPKALKND